jgi:ethanolamine permease
VGVLEFENTDNRLAGWQAAGLTLAVISVTAFQGLGALAGVVLLGPVLYAFTRLRAHSPTARSTADLVGGVLGGRAAAFTGAVQTAGYTLLAAAVVPAAGVGIVFLTPNTFAAPEALVTSWWPTAASVILVAVAGLLAYVLTARALATVVGLLAVAGLLIHFYFALAIVARVLSGSRPVMIGEHSPTSGLGLTSLLVLLALSLVGFEVTTVRNRQVRSLGWPAGIAIAAVTACAVTIWFADHLGSRAGFRLDVSQFPSIANEFYGADGSRLLIVSVVAIKAAVLLGLVWAAAQVIGRLGRGGATGGATAGVAAIAAVLVVAFCRDWGGITDKVGHAGELLLLVVYVLVAEANSRIADDDTTAWWIRIYVPALLAAAAVLPLLYFNFAAFVVWPVAVTAVVVFLAAVAASVLARRPG